MDLETLFARARYHMFRQAACRFGRGPHSNVNEVVVALLDALIQSAKGRFGATSLHCFDRQRL